ncbi:MAG: hypothetical protein IKT38_02890 [Clostridia bacterium]|nr:hypothetical protein [Clostridia bacterium]
MIENNVILYRVILLSKQMIVKYLNDIWPYIKLSEICKEYNVTYPENIIDYNNLRNVINSTAPNRLSEDKLLSFYNFLIKNIFQDKFKIKSNELNALKIKEIIQQKTTEMVSEVSEALEHGFSNKQ